jgi:hypothetical protein
MAPAANRATINKTTIHNVPTLLAVFDDHGNAAVQYQAHHPMEVVHGFHKSH